MVYPLEFYFAHNSKLVRSGFEESAPKTSKGKEIAHEVESSRGT